MSRFGGANVPACCHFIPTLTGSPTPERRLPPPTGGTLRGRGLAGCPSRRRSLPEEALQAAGCRSKRAIGSVSPVARGDALAVAGIRTGTKGGLAPRSRPTNPASFFPTLLIALRPRDHIG